MPMLRNHLEQRPRQSGLTLVSPDVKQYYDHEPLIAAVDHHNRQRPSYLEADRRASYMSNYIRLELAEVAEELNKEGQADFSPKALAGEYTDVLVVSTSLPTSIGVPIDQNRIWPYVNGQGTHSNILERMSEVTGDITENNIDKPVHEVLTLLASAITHAPVKVDVADTLFNTVIPKNRRNHFARYYSGKDDLNGGKQLERDEMLLQYDHVYKALRLFRKAFAGPKGLPPEEHLPYAMLIQDFRHSAFALEMIKHIIALEKTQRQSAIT